LIRGRWERWLETSRLNPIGLLRMPWPSVSPEEARRFDELLAAAPPGGEIEYGLPAPKWLFLHHLVRHGYALHGTNESAIEEFRTRQTFDAYQRPIDAVFATDDAIWALYFAVVRRDGLEYGYINWCVRPRARLAVEPDDFPFRRRTMQHGKGATPASVTRRAALTRHRSAR
jgi:hypothetical protein